MTWSIVSISLKSTQDLLAVSQVDNQLGCFRNSDAAIELTERRPILRVKN